MDWTARRQGGCRDVYKRQIVDEAHGAHFGFGGGFPENAVKLGADAVIMSLHKTLPSFTQDVYKRQGYGVGAFFMFEFKFKILKKITKSSQKISTQHLTCLLYTSRLTNYFEVNFREFHGENAPDLYPEELREMCIRDRSYRLQFSFRHLTE